MPATAPEIETTAQVFGADEIARLAALPGVIALGEVMDYRGLLGLSQRLPPMLAAAQQAGLRLEGHIPTLEGMELSEYLSYGITSSHSLTTPEKMYAELSKGVAVMLQTKSLTAENMAAVMALPDRSGVLLVTDDIEPSLLRKGHLSLMVELAVRSGLPALEALASASLRPARYLGLRDLGGIAPGYRADFLVLEDLAHFPPRQVWVGGRQVAADGHMLALEQPAAARRCRISRRCPGRSAWRIFASHAGGDRGSLPPTPCGWITTSIRSPAWNRCRCGWRMAMPALRRATTWRWRRFLRAGGASACVGIIKDLGILSGAAATSMAHDSHNLLVVGREAEAMLRAANAVHGMGGGVAVASTEAVTAALELPVFSLLADRPVEGVAAGYGAGGTGPLPAGHAAQAAFFAAFAALAERQPLL